MPLNYLESGPELTGAIRGLGSQFNEAFTGLALARMRQQQFMAQQAMEMQRIALERQRLQDELLTSSLGRSNVTALMKERAAKSESELETERATRGEIESETDYRRALTKGSEQTTQDVMEQRMHGGMLGDVMKGLATLDPEKDPMTWRNQVGLMMREAANIAAYNPATIGQQVSEISSFPDPTIRRLIATNTRSVLPAAPGTSLIDIARPGGPGPVYTAPFRPPTRSPVQDLESAVTAAGRAMRGSELNPSGAAYTQGQSLALQALEEMRTKLGLGATNAPVAPPALKRPSIGLAPRTLKVRSREGVVGLIPADQEQDAIAEGYEILGPGEGE